MKQQGITVDTLRGILPFIFLLATLIFAWTDLTSRLAISNERGEVTSEKVGNIENKVDDISNKQNDIRNELTRLATIIEGQRSISSSGNRVASVTSPSPTPIAFFTTNEREIVFSPQSNPQPQPTPVPTVEPEPNPTPSVVQSILDLVGGIL